MTSQCFAFGPFCLDLGRRLLLRDGAVVPLGNRALLVLEALVAARGNVVTKSELMTAGWPKSVVEESNLTVQIAALRKLLGPAPEGGEWIATVSRIGYRFIGANAVDPEPVEAPPATRTKDVAHKPSIAVLPFVNLSRDPEQEYFADGITEDVITALSRFRWFFVIARNSSFAYKGRAIDVRQVGQQLGVAYVLEGSVRKSAGRVRISAQLVNAASGSEIWADRYDFDLVDMFTVQDRIAEQVAGAIEPALLKTESDPSSMRSPDHPNLGSWDMVRRGTFCFHQVTRETHHRAREFFREACRVDPGLPDGHFWLARVNAGLVAFNWSDDPAADLREGLDAATRAIHLEERNPYAHYGLAINSLFAEDFEKALRAGGKAVELSPSFALGHLVLGAARLFSGDARGACESLQYGLRLNPYDPHNFVWYNFLTLAHLFSGEPEQALACTVKAAQIRPAWRPTYVKMICCHQALGNTHEARRCLQQLVGLERPPGDTLAALRRHQPQWTDQLAELLSAAGVSAAEFL